MQLDLYDATGLVASKVVVDNDHEAVVRVLRAFAGPGDTHLVRAVLRDAFGQRCIWERKPSEAGAPKITERSDRFKGVWQDGGTAV